MSDTPETDEAKLQAASNYNILRPNGWDFARRMERERDEARKSEIAAIAEREKWRMQAEQKWAMRRELEEILEVTEGAACDEQFAKGIEALRQLKRERDEARELARNLYWAGYDLRRFARAYANNYDEADGKRGAEEADYAFCEASINLAKVLGEEKEAAK